ncbi:uncharacterized protein P174DRAFT_367661, partial [Aspergillus novofumigatus IBT 16806]
ILTLLKDSGIALLLIKCHFTYLSIKILGHHVSRLRISTTKDKITIIRVIAFLDTLEGLKKGVTFFNYY